MTAEARAGAGPSSVSERFPAVPESASAARRLVTGWLRAQGADELMIDDVAITVSEACANAVVHAYRDAPPRSFEVSAESRGELVRVTVVDDGGGMEPRADSEGIGLGLALMAALSDSLEIAAGPQGAGTVVSMRFSPEGTRAREDMRSAPPQ